MPLHSHSSVCYYHDRTLNLNLILPWTKRFSYISQSEGCLDQLTRDPMAISCTFPNFTSETVYSISFHNKSSSHFGKLYWPQGQDSWWYFSLIHWTSWLQIFHLFSYKIPRTLTTEIILFLKLQIIPISSRLSLSVVFTEQI